MGFSQAIEAGQAFLKILVDDKEVAKGFERVQSKLDTVGRSFTKFGAITGGIGAAITGPLAIAVKQFAGAGAAIDDMTKRTGFSAKALGELSYAAQQSGADIAGVEKAIKGMEKFMLGAERGGAGFLMTLDAIGVSIEQLQGQAPERQFQILSEAVAGIDDPTTRAALAMKLFGKSGADLLPLLVEGKDGIAALRAEAQRLGVVMSDEDVAAAAAFDDALSQLSIQFGAVVNAIGAAVAGPILEYKEEISGAVRAVIDWIKQNGELISSVGLMGGALTLSGGAIAGIGTAAKLSVDGIGMLMKAVKFLYANPVIAGLVAVADAFHDIGTAATAADKAVAAANHLGALGVARPKIDISSAIKPKNAASAAPSAAPAAGGNMLLNGFHSAWAGATDALSLPRGGEAERLLGDASSIWNDLNRKAEQKRGNAILNGAGSIWDGLTKIGGQQGAGGNMLLDGLQSALEGVLKTAESATVNLKNTWGDWEGQLGGLGDQLSDIFVPPTNKLTSAAEAGAYTSASTFSAQAAALMGGAENTQLELLAVDKEILAEIRNGNRQGGLRARG